VVDVKLCGKRRALKLAARSGILEDRTDVTMGEELKRDMATLRARTPTAE
jgi:hypothetical protein